MTNRKSTKKALLMSALSLLLCFSMLVGTTFAWFTDEVQSGTNQIVAGNLDVDVLTADSKSIEKSETLFNDVTYWEPGAVAFENLTVTNLGTLALKYQMSVNFTNENTVLTDGVAYGLSEVLKIAVVGKIDEQISREDLIASIDENAWAPLADFILPGDLEKSESDVYGIVIWWEPSDADNNWNVQNGKPTSDNAGYLHIDLGIKLVATQLSAESDSFGPDYDEGAPWMGGVSFDWYTADPEAQTFTISTGEELAGLAAIVNGTATAPITTFATTSANKIHDDFAGKTIKLDANINLSNIPWTPIGRIGVTSTDFTYAFKGTFDGQGYTVSNLDVDAYGWAGLFGIAYKAQINNVKINGASIKANRMAGAVVGQLYGSIDNCHVAGAQIMVTPNWVGDTYDNGDKVGGIVGWIGDNGNNRTLTNCSATGVELGAYRDVGGIAGYVAKSTTVSGNKVDQLKITVDQISYNYGEQAANAGAIYGRISGTIIDENNTQGGAVEITATFAKDGITYMQDGVTKETTLYLVPADYEGTTVNVAAGTTAIGGYAFAYNSNIETIVLPSTVTKLNDRAFRDTSATTVVLNEGLTNISYQAFRNASNVKNVVIPSTVTTISKEAFQNSGVTTLTIPANVTTFEYGACRDMKMLETVVIEGDVDIPVYAFRACTNLKTVVLVGENVTIGGGSRGMIFTTKDNGDGSAITIYVANETVKERLLAADTAAKDYGGYTIVVGAETITDADTLVEALENGEDVVLTGDVEINPAGMSNAYGTTGINVKNGQTIDGCGNVLDIKGAGGTWDSGISTTGGLIKDITITGSFRGIFVNHNSTHSEKVVLQNVIIDGTVYTISCDQGSNQGLEATDCTFNGWTSYAATIGNVKFNNCSFGEGSGYAFCRPYAPTEFVGCDFESGFKMDPRAAVTFEDCTIGGEPLTAEKLSTLVISNIGNATVK